MNVMKLALSTILLTIGLSANARTVTDKTELSLYKRAVDDAFKKDMQCVNMLTGQGASSLTDIGLYNSLTEHKHLEVADGSQPLLVFKRFFTENGVMTNIPYEIISIATGEDFKQVKSVQVVINEVVEKNSGDLLNPKYERSVVIATNIQCKASQ